MDIFGGRGPVLQWKLLKGFVEVRKELGDVGRVHVDEGWIERWFLLGSVMGVGSQST